MRHQNFILVLLKLSHKQPRGQQRLAKGTSHSESQTAPKKAQPVLSRWPRAGDPLVLGRACLLRCNQAACTTHSVYIAAGGRGCWGQVLEDPCSGQEHPAHSLHWPGTSSITRSCVCVCPEPHSVPVVRLGPLCRELAPGKHGRAVRGSLGVWSRQSEPFRPSEKQGHLQPDKPETPCF
jgi:hypothetical protein